MAFRLPKKITDNSVGTITDINQNFAAIETELNNFPQDGILIQTQWVTGEMLAGGITSSKLGRLKTGIYSSSSDANLVSQTAVVNYVNSKK
jgi:hypothetical protein